MAKFKWSICEPLNPKIIERGEIEAEKVVATFESFPWEKYLDELNEADEKSIHFSPSLEFRNTDHHHGLTFSAVGVSNNFEFYLFYVRPKTVSKFFGLIQKFQPDFRTDLIGISQAEAVGFLNALVDNKLDFLEQHIR
ncbi:hypothetical protein GC194_00320 [bacterium]|nr:hypothetical protein [bacterium]